MFRGFVVRFMNLIFWHAMLLCKWMYIAYYLVFGMQYVLKSYPSRRYFLTEGWTVRHIMSYKILQVKLLPIPIRWTEKKNWWRSYNKNELSESVFLFSSLLKIWTSLAVHPSSFGLVKKSSVYLVSFLIFFLLEKHKFWIG